MDSKVVAYGLWYLEITKYFLLMAIRFLFAARNGSIFLCAYSSLRLSSESFKPNDVQEIND